MIYDLSPKITPDLKVWPGDSPPTREVLLELEKGDSVTLSTLRATVHLGSHVDGPNHYGVGARSVDEMDLDYYLGPCRVVTVDAVRGERVPPETLPDGIVEPRVLLKTGTYPDPNHFNEDFAALSPEIVTELHRRGVRLVGVDCPSVDSFDSKDLPAHRRFLDHDMAILEGLRLDHVPDGVYELIALPLALVGFDGSPVRAVLRDLPGLEG